MASNPCLAPSSVVSPDRRVTRTSRSTLKLSHRSSCRSGWCLNDKTTEEAYDAGQVSREDWSAMQYWPRQGRSGTFGVQLFAFPTAAAHFEWCVLQSGVPLLRDSEQGRTTMSKSDTDTRTDAACTTGGIYRSDCADQERVTLTVGDAFPRCPSCRKAVGWNLAVAT